MKTKKLDKKLNGYHRHFKGRFLLLKNGLLKDSEYLLWDLSFSVLAIWDKKYKDTYGTFELTQKEIGYYLGWSASKVCRLSKKLVKLKLWKPLEDKQIQVCGYEINEHYADLTKKVKRIDLQQFLSSKQLLKSKLKPKTANMESSSSKGSLKFQGNSTSKLQSCNAKEPLVSFKDNISSLRDNKEYEDLSKETGFSVKDLIEIDESIEESKKNNSNNIPQSIK